MTKVKVGAVAAVLFLIGAYVLAQGTKDAVDGNTATVTVTWSNPPGVIIIVRIAGGFQVKGKTFYDTPFTDSYPVKRGDNVLVTVDPIPASDTATHITCLIVIPGQPAVNDAGTGHRICHAVIK